MRVVITGASRGIGHALYRGYEARGDTVIGTSRRGDGPYLPLDLLDPAQAAALPGLIDGDGGIDLLVCNAGVYLDKGQPLETGFDAATWAHTLAVNVTGVFLVIQALLPRLRAAAPGARIAIIGSQMGSDTTAPGGSYIYRASKAAALNLGRNLATDLRAEGISVGIYHPGWVQSDMGGARADVTPAQSAQGLMARFDALTIDQTGCFLTWDGRPHPF